MPGTHLRIQPFSAEEEEACAAISHAGAPLWLGNSNDAGVDFLHSLGFSSGGDTAQILRAVDKAGATSSKDG